MHTLHYIINITFSSQCMLYIPRVYRAIHEAGSIQKVTKVSIMHMKLCVWKQENYVIKLKYEPARMCFLQCHYNKKSLLPGIEDDHILLIVGFLWVLWSLPHENFQRSRELRRFFFFKKKLHLCWERYQRFRIKFEYFIKSYFLSISNLDFIVVFPEGK